MWHFEGLEGENDRSSSEVNLSASKGRETWISILELEIHTFLM
jgi:hypothetical protein